MESSLHPLEAVIFDLDGTLVDTLDLIHQSFNAAVASFEEREYEVEEVVRLFGPPMEEILVSLLGEEEAPGAVDTYYSYFEENCSTLTQVYDGVSTVLEEIEGDVKAAIVTGAGRRGATVLMQEMGLEGHFDVLVAGTDIEKPKPHPEGVLMAVERLGVSNRHTLFVGNSPKDVQAGRAADVYTGAALWGARSAEETLGAKPHFVFVSPRHLLTFLISEG